MSRATLILISLLRDLLDIVMIGQIPGLNWILNLPVIYCHYRYAGLRAAFTLFENIPVVEAFPGFTVAALTYPEPVLPETPTIIDGEKISSN